MATTSRNGHPEGRYGQAPSVLTSSRRRRPDRYENTERYPFDMIASAIPSQTSPSLCSATPAPPLGSSHDLGGATSFRKQLVMNAEPHYPFCQDPLMVTSDQMSQAGAFNPADLRSVVPKELAGILPAVVRTVAAGGTVTIGSIPEELTTTSAAELLGISRPTLMTLVREGQIAAHKVGTHTRLDTADVLAYRDRLRNRQRVALQKLRDFEEAEGLDY